MRMRNQEPTSTVPTGPWQPCYRTGSVLVPGCGRPINPLCDVQKIGNFVRNIQPQATWTLNVAPRRSDLFQALAYRNVVSGNADPSINGRLIIQQLEVNESAIEAFSVAPNIATLVGVSTDDYVLPDGYGVPVNWPPFTQANLVQTLLVGGISLYPAGGPAFDYLASCYGNSIAAAAPGAGA